jgi:hypothetical protein
LMILPKNFYFVALTAALLLLPATAQSGRLTSVNKVSVLTQTPLQIQIQTNLPASSQVQMVPNPDRLVIDIPNSVAATTLRGLAINRADVRGVRVSQYSMKPPVTRVVVDLNSPEWYRVVPNASGLMVSLGNEGQSAQSQPAIGWVSAKVRNVRTAPAVLRQAVATSPAPVNGVRVQFANGQLTIHATNATLSEVLFQIQKCTGAEIAIPSGSEQERVAADFGPGTASEVMGQLLNGTDLNFVVVGSTSNPNQLRSVILTRKTGGADPPPAFAVEETEAETPPVPVIDAQSLDSSAPPPRMDPPPDNAPGPAPDNGPQVPPQPADQGPN